MACVLMNRLEDPNAGRSRQSLSSQVLTRRINGESNKVFQRREQRYKIDTSIPQRGKFEGLVANKNIHKYRGIKCKVSITNNGNNKVQNSKCTLASVDLLHGCSTTNAPLLLASSNLIFNTMVQKGLKPHEALFGSLRPGSSRSISNGWLAKGTHA